MWSVEHRHLSAADTGADVRHAVVVTDGRVLVVGVSIAGLSGIPHHLVGVLCAAANQGTAARGRNHLVAVERQHAVLSERTEHLSAETRPHAFGCIFHYGNAVFVGNRHDFVNAVRHTTVSYTHLTLPTIA